MIFLTKRRNFKPNRQRKLEALRSKFHTQLKWISIECQHISNANQTFRYLTVSLLNEVIGMVRVISAVDNFSCSYVIREKIYNDRNKKPKIKQIRIKKNNSLLKKLKLESRIWKPIPKGMKTKKKAKLNAHLKKESNSGRCIDSYSAAVFYSSNQSRNRLILDPACEKSSHWSSNTSGNVRAFHGRERYTTGNFRSLTLPAGNT